MVQNGVSEGSPVGVIPGGRLVKSVISSYFTPNTTSFSRYSVPRLNRWVMIFW